MNAMNEQSTAYWSLNVRLETGYRYEDDVVIGTETGLFHVKIENGAFSEIRPAEALPDTLLPTRDMQGI